MRRAIPPQRKDQRGCEGVHAGMPLQVHRLHHQKVRLGICNFFVSLFFFVFPISLCNFCAVFSFPYDFDAISMFVNHGEYRALEISCSNTNNERSIASEDLLSALQGVGLSDYSHALGLYLQRYREVISLFTVLFQFYCSSSFLR